MEPSAVKRRLTCILAADAVGYSVQMGEDEEATLRVLSAHRAVIDAIIAFHNGRILSTAGDSVLAEFASAVEAVRCAVEIQDALRTRNDALPEPRRMLFRIGVNLGDVMVKNDDLLGDGVNVAARLEGIAEAGGICISSSVYDQITGKLDLGFLDIGEQQLKNITRPIRVFRVSGSAATARSAPTRAAPALRRVMPAALLALSTVAIAALAAWQAGWLHFGASESGAPQTARVPPTAAPAPGTPAVAAASAALPAQSENERLRSDAEAAKRQAAAELAQARAEANAARAAKAKTEGGSAAAKRAQAATDSAVVPAAAGTTGARSRIESPPAVAGAPAAMPGSAATLAKTDATRSASAPTPAPAPDADRTAPAAMTAANNVAGYDGTWAVTVVCPAHRDGTLGYTLAFFARVKDGFLRGERGNQGGAGWLLLEGPIQPDGSAILNARGTTDDPRYAIARADRGSAYAYTVAARFGASRGSGQRQETRPCDLQFVKQ